MPKALQIKTLPLSDKIHAEGLYDIPLWRYHSDICAAPSVSSSEIRTLAESGEEYFAKSKYNPEYNPLEEYKAHIRHFKFGHAAHARILMGAEDWHKEDFILIPPKWSKKTFRTKDLAEWVWMQEVRKGLIAIFEHEVAAVDAMAAKIMDHPEANALFEYGIPELSLIFKEGETYVKARPDILPVRPVDPKGKIIKKRELLTSATKYALGSTLISDFKTIDDNSPALCKYAITKWGYDLKLANVGLASCRLFDVDFADLTFGLVFQKSKTPWGITTIEVDPHGDYMHMLVAKAIYGMHQFAKGMEPVTGEWEGYVTEILRYTPSGYFMDDLKKMIDSGTYPNLDKKLRVVEARP